MTDDQCLCFPIESHFFAAWCYLEDLGGCDGWGGSECRRVYCEWVAAERPEPEAFIRARANIDANGDVVEILLSNERDEPQGAK